MKKAPESALNPGPNNRLATANIYIPCRCIDPNIRIIFVLLEMVGGKWRGDGLWWGIG